MVDSKDNLLNRWRTVKVFISSTFRDMFAERDHLVKVVFPALREKLGKYRAYLIDIDLRWGVTKEQADNDQVLDLCLDLIDECRPFFIGILAERYGWIPKKIPAEAIRKYGWVQHVTDKSLTELEILHGVLNNPEMRGHAFFYFRDPDTLSKIPDKIKKIYVESDPDLIKKLIDLKERIRHSGHPVMDPYPAQWDAEAYNHYTKTKGQLAGLKEFGDRIQEQIWERIKEELILPDKPPTDTEADPLAVEQDYHERFLEPNLRFYIERGAIQQALLTHLEIGDNRTLMVSGPSGSGKTATLSWLSREADNIYSAGTVIPHFVGASEASTSLSRTLERLCETTTRRFQIDSEMPTGENLPFTTAIENQISRFRDCLNQVPDTERLIMIIDAIDQLDPADNPQELAWLPDSTPQNVQIIVSCSDANAKPYRALERAREKGLIEVVLDPLTSAEQMEMVRHIPAISAKALDENQIAMLLSSGASTNPLFLTIALEELRIFGSFDHLGQRIAAFPQLNAKGDHGEAIRSIFKQVIERLELEFDPQLVQTSITLLACARRGLAEDELKQLVAGMPGAQDLFPVLRQLRSYLMKRGTLIDFRYRELGQTVHEVYLQKPTIKNDRHVELADFFESIGNTGRLIQELPFQLAEAEQWTRLYEKMSDTTFLYSMYNNNRDDDVHAYWSLIEQKTPYKLLETFHDFIDNPQQHDYDSVWLVTSLIDHFGYHHKVIELRQYLSESSEGLKVINLIDANLNLASSMQQAGNEDGALALLREEEARCRKLIFVSSMIATMKKVIPLFQRYLADCLAGQAIIFYERNQPKTALELQKKCESIYHEIGSKAGVQKALGEQGLINQDQGNLSEALELYQQKEQMCRELGNQQGLQLSYGYQASVYLAWGNYYKAKRLLDERRKICRKLGMLDSLASSLGEEAHFQNLHKDDQGALVLYREQEQLLRELHLESELKTCLENIAEICAAHAQHLYEKQEWEGAWKLLAESQQVFDELGDEENLGLCFANQAMICFIKGDREKGISLLRQKQALAKNSEETRDHIEFLDQMIATLKDDMYFAAAKCLAAEKRRIILG